MKEGQQHILACAAVPVTFGRAGYGRRANSSREQSGEKGILQEEGIVTGVPGKEEVQQFFAPL